MALRKSKNMANNKYEKAMVQKFVINLPKSVTKILHSNINSRSNPDLVFEITINGVDETHALECKSDKATESVTNYYKQLFGEILINRKRIKTKKIFHGIFINYDNSKLNKFHGLIRKNIHRDDWKKFCEGFNCKYVFLYDENNSQLYRCDWADFYKKKPTITVVQ
jgi:hypothetical protein